MRYKYSLIILSSIILLSGCSKETSDNVTAKPAEEAQTVTISKVTLRPLPIIIRASGTLVPRLDVMVGPAISGYVVSDILVDAGDSVEKNQPLLKLDSSLLRAKIKQAEANLAQAKALEGLAKSEAARVAGLDGTGVLSDEQIGTRRSQAKSAIAATAVASAQLEDFHAQNEKMIVRSPVDGLVLARSVHLGDVASLSEPMFRIAKDNEIELNTEVPEANISSIAKGQQAEIISASGAKFTGIVRLISPQVNPDTKLGDIRISLPSDNKLRTGSFADAIFTPPAQPLLVVPEKAVQFEASGPLVVIIDKDNRAHRVSIKTGIHSDGFIAVEGLEIGARVALGGGAFLLDNDLVNPIVSSPDTITEKSSDTIIEKE